MRSLFYLLFLSTAAQAESQQFKPIIVKASRLSSPGITFHPNSATVAEKDIDHQQFTHVLDALQNIPGITVVQSGATGSQTTIFTRGTNGNHTQVRLDGMRANDPGSANGSFNFAELSTDGLEKIEIIRGAHSSLYGSNAIGGVILTTTKAGSGKPKAVLDGEFGSFHTFREKMELQGQAQGVKLAASASRFDTKGITLTPKKYQNSSYRQKPDGNHQTSVNSRLDLVSPNTTTLTLFNRLSSSKDHFRNYGAPATRENQFQLHRAVLSNEILSNYWQHHFGIGYLRSFTPLHIKDRKPNHSTGQRVQIDWQHDFTVHPSYRIKLVGEWERDKFTFHSSTQNNHGKRRSFALRNLHAIDITENWLMELGFSKDWNSNFHAPIDYRFSSSYTIAATATQFLVSLGTGFKAPTLYELYADFPSFRANPDLKAEKNFAWDVGIEQKIGQDVQGNLTYFHNNLKNIIQANSTYTQLINQGTAHTYGIESTLTWAMTSCWKGTVGYTWTRTENEETHHSLMRRPKHKVSLTLLYQSSDIKAGLSGLYTSRAPDFHPTNFGRTHRPSFLTIRLFGDYALCQNLKVHGRVENALNRHYQDPLGYKKPGFSVYAGLKYTLS
jgi:vitamin B12 transporter